jgi:RNA polymerase sigma factor (sigma-70 family)
MAGVTSTGHPERSEAMTPLSNQRVPQIESGVNPHSPTEQAMWNQIVELEPVIVKCARRMASIYNDSEDADELADHARMALIEKARRIPQLLSQSNTYIFQVIKNEIHSYYRRLLGYRLQYHVTSLSDLDEMLPGDDDALDSSERAEAVRSALAGLDDECRELVNAILDNANADLIRDGDRSRGMVNVSALAERMGKQTRSIYRDVSRLRSKLAMVIA